MTFENCHALVSLGPRSPTFRKTQATVGGVKEGPQRVTMSPSKALSQHKHESGGGGGVHSAGTNLDRSKRAAPESC